MCDCSGKVFLNKEWKKTWNVLFLIYLAIYNSCRRHAWDKASKIRLIFHPKKKKKKKKKKIENFFWDRNNMVGKSIKAKAYKKYKFEKKTRNYLKLNFEL